MPEETLPQPLPHDDAQFEVFRMGCANRQLMLISYLAPVPDDPALPEDMRKRGLETVVEGHAISCDDNAITFVTARMAPVSDSSEAMQQATQRTIPRSRVLTIRPIGESTAVFERGL